MSCARQVEFARSVRKPKLNLEGWSLIIDDGLLSERQNKQMPRSGRNTFDINKLRLLPSFNERDPNAFKFCLSAVLR